MRAPIRFGITLPLALVAVACGGEDKGRISPTLDDMFKGAALENCDAEVAIGAENFLLLTNGNFEATSATKWARNVDGSPLPATAPRPILGTCPEDSQFDCCIPTDDPEWNPVGPLTPEQLARVPQEKALQAGYVCAPPSADVQYCPSLKSGPFNTQDVDLPIACKAGQPTGRALHIRAARLTDWGAQVYFNFQDFEKPKQEFFDASAYDGISFWVRLGQGGSGAQPVGHTLFIAFDDRFTKEGQPKLIWEQDADGNYLTVSNANGDPVPVPHINPLTGKQSVGTMDASSTDAASAPMAPANQCYDVGVDALKCDRFGAGVGLDPEWRFVKIPFSEMKQRGYGVVSPAGRVLREELLAFDIYTDIGNWDFWIDQVAFYREPAKASAL